MNTLLPEGQIWAWTDKAESEAVRLGLEPRVAGTPAYMGYSALGNSAPGSWVRMGYVVPACVEDE